MIFVIVVCGTAAVRIGYRQQQTVAGIFETGDVFQRVGMGQQVARFVIGIAVVTAFGIAFTDQTVVVVIVEMLG